MIPDRWNMFLLGMYTMALLGLCVWIVYLGLSG